MAGDTGETWRLGHRPALDGVRAIAVILVLVFHTWATFTPTIRSPLGIAGVMMFFTLSGFLITALLLDERECTGRVSFQGFYRRRALRLFPALAVFVAIGGALQVVASELSAAGFLSIAFYVANWASLMGVELGWIKHTWSLAVEEQFYLVWPVLLWVSLRWRHGPLVVCVVGVAVSCALRVVLWDGGDGARRIYRGSDTEAFALLAGCMLAVLLKRGLLRPSRWAWPAGVALGGVALCAALLEPTPWNECIVVPLAVPVAAAVAIWAVSGDARSRWLGSAVLRYVGRRSYAIYLWHPITLLFGAVLLGSSPLAVAVSMGVVVLLAEVSWRLVEQPFLRLKGSAVPADLPPRLRGRVDASR